MLTSDVATLPATSVAVSVSVLSPLTSGGAQSRTPFAPRTDAPLHVAAAMPESASMAVPLSAAGETSVVAPGSGEVIVTTGAMVSMLSNTDAVAVLPARSCAAPLTLWPAPSDEIVTGCEHEPTVDRLSVQTKLTVTSVRFHPALLAAGAGAAAIAGGVLSMLRV